MKPSIFELTLAAQLDQAGIPFEREYLFHPTRKWRLSNVVESGYGEGRIAPHGSVSILRPTLPSGAFRCPVLLAPLWEPSVARSAAAHPPMSTMRRGVRTSVVSTSVLLGCVPICSRGRQEAARWRTGQGLGERCPSRCAQSELERRRGFVQGIPQQGRTTARKAATLFQVRDDRSAVDLRLGEPNRQLRRSRRLRANVSPLPSAVRQ